jgi:hypothetical protein
MDDNDYMKLFGAKSSIPSEKQKEYVLHNLEQWEGMYGDVPCRVIIREMYNFYENQIKSLTEGKE